MRRAARRSPAGPTVGTIIANRYRLEHPLGEGGMAEVFRAEDLVAHRRVAVKVLRSDIATNPEAVERTKREGELLSQLDNPAIVHVESWGQLEDGTVFLVMELLEGETLGERMRRGPLDAADLAPIVAGTCAGLHAAHKRGIVHRDLKPDNIFLCPTDHGLQVKLLDFGISKVYGGEKLTQTGEVLGTPRYMSPEQLGAEPDVDARVDVYALGVILYEALAGKPPFVASTPTDLIIAILNGKLVPLRSVRPELPAAVESVVMRAMSKVRAARFDTAMALAEAYVDAVGGVAAVRSAQHRGMATRAMGSMMKGPVAPPSNDSMPGTRPPPDVGGDAVAGNLRLGTFSGLEASPAPVEPQAAPPIDKRTMAMGSSAGASVPASVGAPVIAQPEVDTAWVAHAPTQAVAQVTASQVTAAPKPARPMPQTRETPLGMIEPEPVAPAPPPRAVAQTAVMTSHPGSLPGAVPSRAPGGRSPVASSPAILAQPVQSKRSGKILLVLAALLAGAASAALMIGALHLYDRATGSPAAQPAPTPTLTPTTQDEDDAPTDPPAVDPPAGVDPPPAVDPPAVAPSDPPPSTATPEPTTSRPRTARRERPESETTEPERPVSLPGFGGSEGQPSNPNPLDALNEAQRALRSGDPARCVEILNDAITRGAPSLALRRRADCLEAAGQHDAAIRDYQRFCRLVPDHPAMAEVRPLLESWGRSCP
jgi:serine/threonine-protein kinase